MKRKENRNKIFILLAAVMFIISTLFFAKTDFSAASTQTRWIDEKNLGEICIKHIVHTLPEKSLETAEYDDKKKTTEAVKKDKKDNHIIKKEKKDKPDTTVNEGKPLVIIYHTHSSESYMPYKESNYHREDEKGTVREVGSVLKTELEKKGISVVHDKTLHDRPSYNESYKRSLDTITKLRKRYPEAVYVIDLHRDASASGEGKTLEIDGQRVAEFSLVVGKQNDNYTELYRFAEKVGIKSGEMYEGFRGQIIEQNYKYNGYISDRSMLLEIGNNKNTIDEAKLCGKYIANVLATVIKEEQ